MKKSQPHCLQRPANRCTLRALQQMCMMFRRQVELPSRLEVKSHGTLANLATVRRSFFDRLAEVKSNEHARIRILVAPDNGLRPDPGDELRALLQRGSPSSPFVFVSERQSLFTSGAHGRARRCRRRPGAQGTPAQAAPRLLLRAGQQGPRHPGDPGVARASVGGSVIA
jgi:hypothetical protein